MADDTPLTDDYVAQLLLRDAKTISSRAAAGLTGGISKRPAGTAKPNTRFLNNIIRDTDHHNASLLAKEQQESRARLAALSDRRRPSRRAEQKVYSVRDRQRTNQSDSERQRFENVSTCHTNGQCLEGDAESRGRLSRLAARSNDEERSQRRHGEDRNRSRSPRRLDVRSRHGDSHASTSRRHSRIEDDRGTDSRRSRSPSRRHQSRRSNRSHSQTRSHRPHDRHQKPKRRERQRDNRMEDTRKTRTDADDSDAYSSSTSSGPGPHPATRSSPLRSRGRGAMQSDSTMDRHFTDSYDPKADVEPDEEAHDWDQALEALKDRQKWRQSGAQRLKAAGFTDDEVRKWEKGDRKDEEDVRWTKRGESREWDRGKDIELD